MMVKSNIEWPGGWAGVESAEKRALMSKMKGGLLCRPKTKTEGRSRLAGVSRAVPKSREAVLVRRHQDAN
jgi:hypothetical protein